MSALRPQPRPGVLDIDPYVPGKSTAPGVARVFKLSSNETPLGPSPKALAAYRAVADHLQDYPDGAALLISVPQDEGIEPVTKALVKAGASVRATALVGSHATRYRVSAD